MSHTKPWATILLCLSYHKVPLLCTVPVMARVLLWKKMAHGMSVAHLRDEAAAATSHPRSSETTVRAMITLSGLAGATPRQRCRR